MIDDDVRTLAGIEDVCLQSRRQFFQCVETEQNFERIIRLHRAAHGFARRHFGHVAADRVELQAVLRDKLAEVLERHNADALPQLFYFHA